MTPTTQHNIRGFWSPQKPYNELPSLPPQADLESKVILKQCITARAQLAELKQAGKLIPNQAVLISTLPMLEAQASSEIENIITTTDRLFQFRALDEHADPATKEALRYSQALLEGFHSLQHRPLATGTAEAICSQIKGFEMRIRKVPGTALARNDEIIYTPPVGEELLRSLLSNWERFLHTRTDIDPLIRMAVAHYQFEAIHPFTDGNGRTGRVLNSLFLTSQDLLPLPLLYLSRYIIQNKSTYYRLLAEVTKAATWEEWILFMIKGVEETARWTVAKIAAICDLHSHTTKHLRKHAGNAYSRELVDLIFELPYCRILNLTQRDIAARQTASTYLKKLVTLHVLEERIVGREKLFIHPKLMQLLTRDTNNFTPYK
jgi:Fic family protein